MISPIDRRDLIDDFCEWSLLRRLKRKIKGYKLKSPLTHTVG